MKKKKVETTYNEIDSEIVTNETYFECCECLTHLHFTIV